ncbi:MAG: 4-hydroxybutyrate coenzyme A transferase [Alphaproteobacteria bacterium]|nr:4-hydroxybutyrate coenzyme A transferase [Alphaproteobacteria bacterium]MBU2084601.1 4-hydroxybutyrate coenzyme A transferase [Alphaproteobacteria bacterium]MBU2141988.1 4-hydroxybutyrate coenzyme A transferase [Alphaproteobacteria bacterium]MBU2198400.1 4-hydroxybutyrate coenzyme A transferase [Alphaproteobacteria bacterium]
MTRRADSLAEGFAALRALKPGPARLYLAGCSGEPVGLFKALGTQLELARDLTFVGVPVPGLNHLDWTSLHATARAEMPFMFEVMREGFAAGKIDLRPMHYSDSYRQMQTGPIDLAVIMVSPPDADGRVSLGLSADFSGAVLARPEIRVMAVVNPRMPAPADTLRVPLSRFDVAALDDTPLVELVESALPPVFARIGERIAGLVGGKAACLQFGIGNVQPAALKALADAGGPANLTIHSGLVTDPMLGLIDAGRVVEAPGAILTGVAMGTERLYERVARDQRFRFRGVDVTHGIDVLSAIPRFVAINSVLEVDLFGQANAEFMKGRQVSGIGGLANYLRGAAASEGGMPIVALPSTAAKGQVSRIVARLGPEAVSVPRSDIAWVVTEHGAVNLRAARLDARAEMLISIADPAHRDALANEWAGMRAGV